MADDIKNPTPEAPTTPEVPATPEAPVTPEVPATEEETTINPEENSPPTESDKVLTADDIDELMKEATKIDNIEEELTEETPEALKTLVEGGEEYQVGDSVPIEDTPPVEAPEEAPPHDEFNEDTADDHLNTDDTTTTHVDDLGG